MKFLKTLVLSLSLLFVGVTSSEAAIAFVNSASFAASASTADAPATSNTTGNFLAVYCLAQNGGTTPTISDTASNTFIFINKYQDGSNPSHLYLFYAYNITGNASNVVSCAAGSGSLTAISVGQFSGMGTSAPSSINFAGAAVAGGGTITTASLTQTGTESLIFGGIEDDAQNPGAGSGFTLIPCACAPAYTAAEYKIVTASQTATATASSDGRLAAAIFNLGGSPPAVTSRSLTTMGVGQ